MGQVYQATDTKLNRQVALKILPAAFATDPDRWARFQREAQVLASLNYPAGEDAGRVTRERQEEQEHGTPRQAVLGVFPLLKHPLPVVVAFLLPATDTLDHRRVGNGTHRHGLLQEPMEELPAMA